MTVNPAKTAEPIEMPFGLWTRGGPKELHIRWGPDPSQEGSHLRGITSCWNAVNASMVRQSVNQSI